MQDIAFQTSHPPYISMIDKPAKLGTIMFPRFLARQRGRAFHRAYHRAQMQRLMPGFLPYARIDIAAAYRPLSARSVIQGQKCATQGILHGADSCFEFAIAGSLEWPETVPILSRNLGWMDGSISFHRTKGAGRGV